jgi:prolactin regulatory element-binding protein
MAPKKPKPNTKKFGMPLYASAWADERSLLVAGGGGKKSSGIPNRVCVATFDGETLSEPLFSCHTDETAPQALVMFPDNSRVLCVFGGDVAVYDVTRDPATAEDEALGEDENADPPASQSRAGAGASPYVVKPARLAADGSAARSTVADCDVKCAAFSSDGAKLAVGLEDGRVCICEWADDDDRAGGLTLTKGSGRARRRGDVRELLPGRHKRADDVRRVRRGSGKRRRGALERREEQEAVRLPRPGRLRSARKHGKKRKAKRVVASYRLAAFRADGDVVTVLNVNGEGFVSRWTPEVSKPDDVSWTIVGSIRATRDPVSAASASFDGARVGLGTSEGAVVLVDVGETGSKTKRLRVRACDNSAHMIFVTTLAFSTDGGYVLSGSADASARCAFARRQISAAAAFARVLFSFALLALSFLFLTLFLRRGGVAGFAAMKDTRGSIAPDADGGLDLMQGLDLADAAAQAREALREMAEDAGRVARDEEGAAPASASPTPSDETSGGVAEDTEDTEDADTFSREASRIEPDPVEDASGRMTAGDEEAPREEL